MNIAIDTETFLIFPGNLAPQYVCLTWAAGDQRGIFSHADPGCREFIFEIFEDRDTHITTAYGCFDLAVLCAAHPDLLPLAFEKLDRGEYHDVQMREKLRDLALGCFRYQEDEDGEVRAKGYSLADLVWRYFGQRMDKDTWRLRYHDLYNVPLADWPQGAIDYAGDDAVFTLAIHEAQKEWADLMRDEPPQVASQFALYLTSAWGFKTDPKNVAALERKTLLELNDIRSGLLKKGLIRPDGSRDTKAATRYMLDVAGEENVWFTDAAYSLGISRSAIIDLARDKGKYIKLSKDATAEMGDATLQDYSRYTQLNNLLSGSIKHFKQGTKVPIQTRFDPLKKTGRTGSSDPNIQNLRTIEGVRECFIARDGFVLLAGDYSAAELHTLAQICFDLFGFSDLGEALNGGIDVHCQMGASLIGMAYSEFLALHHEGGHDHIYRARQLAKAANFGFPGGCSAAKFVAIAKQYGVIIDETEGARVKKLWFRAWREMDSYFSHVRSCFEEIDGERWYWVQHPRSDLLVTRLTYTSACNAGFQGLAGRGAKAGHYGLVKETFTRPESPLFDSRVVNFVHDENILETPIEKLHGASVRMKEIMEGEFNQYTPDCPTTVEVVAMKNWSKKAKAVYQNGELQIWT